MFWVCVSVCFNGIILCVQDGLHMPLVYEFGIQTNKTKQKTKQSNTHKFHFPSFLSKSLGSREN